MEEWRSDLPLPLLPLTPGPASPSLRTCRQSNGLDFDDILGLTVALLQQVPEVKEALQRQWAHILVDEFQASRKGGRRRGVSNCTACMLTSLPPSHSLPRSTLAGHQRCPVRDRQAAAPGQHLHHFHCRGSRSGDLQLARRKRGQHGCGVREGLQGPRHRLPQLQLSVRMHAYVRS